MTQETHRPSAYVRTLFVCALSAMCVLSAPVRAAESVQSLRYGASLFHFYQQEYFSALTELMAGQQLEELGPHAEGAELLRGGMALSYGMDDEAAFIFKRELAVEHDRVNINQAWFYLGKLAWQRGDAEGAIEALSHMTPGYAGPLRLETSYLHASALLALGQASEAADIWGGLPFKSLWRRHLSYNLAVDHVAQQEWWKANYYLDTITKARTGEAEESMLVDKAYTAAGYAHLSSGDLAQSSLAFREVRLNGPFRNQALLGYGWAKMEQGDYLAAPGSWQPLASESMLDTSARESLLAVGYVYDRLDRPGTALQKYEFASEQFERASAELEQAITAFSEEPLGSLLGIEESGSGDWLFDEDILPVGKHSRHVQHLVTQQGFQVALRELQDLYTISAQLSRAQQRLDVLNEVDTHQQAVWATLTQEDRRNVLAARQQELAQAQRDTKRKLRIAIDQENGRVLAGPEQTARWSRLERAQALSSQVGASAEVSQRLRILRGLLVWEDSETFPVRAWQARLSIRELNELGVKSERALEQVDAAIAARSQSSFAPRIARLRDEVEAQFEAVSAAIERSESGLRQLAIAELEKQTGHLARAMGQSQLAIAQLYDSARQEAGSE